MATDINTTAISLFSEVLALEHMLRNRVAKVFPKGMELSHFVVLNHLSHTPNERSPAQLAQAFNLSRGAMSNTLSRLETAGYIHIRPDWDDARRKQVVISGAGRQARDAAYSQIAPILSQAVSAAGEDPMRQTIQTLRGLRQTFGEQS